MHDLKEILAVCEKATEGPWEAEHGEWDCNWECGHKAGDPECHKEIGECEHINQYIPADVRPLFTVDCGDFMGLSDDNADFIALARTVLPQLAEEIIKLREKYEQPNPKCGKGHENTLPLALWDCPMCTEELTEENTKLRAVAEAAYVLQKHLDLYDPRIYTRDRDELRNALTAAGYGGED